MLETQAKTIIDRHLLSPPGKPQRVEYQDLGVFVADTLIAYGLEEKALSQPGVQCGHSSDGANFSRSTGLVTTGDRPLDLATVDPLTREPLFEIGLESQGRQLLKNIIQNLV